MQASGLAVRHHQKVWGAIAFYGFLAFGLSAWILKFTYYLASDGITYLRLAENLWSGKGLSMNPGEPYFRHPPFYSFVVGLANLLCRNPEFSAHLVSISSFALTVIPLFFLAQEIYSRNTAHWASLLYVTNGFLLIFSNLTMTESLFTLILFIELFLAHRLLDPKPHSLLWGAWLGILGGLGYLTRSEGLFFYLAILAAIFFLGSKPFQAKLRLGFVSLVLFLIFFTPYLLFIRQASGHWQVGGQARENVIKRQLDVAHPDNYLEVKKIYSELASDKKRFRMDELVDEFRLLDYFTKDDFALLRSLPATFMHRWLGLNRFFFGGLGLLFFGASFLGTPWNKKRLKAEALLFMFLLPFLTYLVTLFYSRRYLPIFPVFLLWMGNGVEVFRLWFLKTFSLNRKTSAAWVLVLLLFLGIPSVWYIRQGIRNVSFPTEDKTLGFWMKANIPNVTEEKVASQTHYASFYAGARILWLPYVEKFEDLYIFMAHQHAKYFIVSEDFDHPVLDAYQFLLDESKAPPKGILRRFSVKGKKKMILYEIQNPLASHSSL